MLHYLNLEGRYLISKHYNVKETDVSILSQIVYIYLVNLIAHTGLQQKIEFVDYLTGGGGGGQQCK